jgi:hypothetical protein
MSVFFFLFLRQSLPTVAKIGLELCPLASALSAGNRGV